jgi:CRP-like cAMP-binding protein
LDIGGSACRQKARYGHAGRGRFDKVPKRGEAVNDGRKTSLSQAPDRRSRRVACAAVSGAVGIFGRDWTESPTKRRFFTVYRRGPADIMMTGAGRSTLGKPFTPEGWLAPMDTSHLAEHAGTAGALFASIFVVATTTMRTMIPLRVFGILANIALFATAIPNRNYLVMGVQAAMLMVNSYRLHQMLQLVRDVKKSVNSDLSMEWLKPFMTERKCEAGFRLVESGIELPVGAIVGEFGMLSPSNMRTQTLECVEAGLILSVSYSKVEELYVQNPEFGFYFLRLVSARLFENIDKLEQRLAQHATPAQASPKPA